MARIKTSDLFFIHVNMRQLLTWLELETGLEFLITSIYRDDDAGVHGTMPVRGIDLRMRNKNIGRAIVHEINLHWVYDSSRPQMNCAIDHGDGANYHIHLQVHDATMLLDI